MLGGEPIRILIAGMDSERRFSMAKSLSPDMGITVIGNASDSAELRRLMGEASPDLIVVQEEFPPRGGLYAIEEITAQSGIPCIFIAETEDPSLMREAMRVGARDFLGGSLDSKTLLESIERIVKQERGRRNKTRDGKANQESHVISVCGAKGGVGRTVTAANLAAALAAREGHTVLFDLNLQFGDASLLLNNTPKRCLADFSNGKVVFNDEILSYCLSPCGTGLHLLITAQTPQHQGLIKYKDVQNILDALRGIFKYIVVDTPCMVEESLLACLSESDRILLLTTGEDLPTLRDTQQWMDSTASTVKNSQRIYLLINRFSPQNSLDPSTVSKTLGIPIAGKIPEDARLVRGSVNRGIPFITSHPKSGLSEEIQRLASQFCTANPGKDSKAPRSGFLYSLLGARKGD